MENECLSEFVHYVLTNIKEIEDSRNVEHEYPRTASNDDQEWRSQSSRSDDTQHVVNVDYGIENSQIETGNQAVEHENCVHDNADSDGHVRIMKRCGHKVEVCNLMLKKEKCE